MSAVDGSYCDRCGEAIYCYHGRDVCDDNLLRCDMVADGWLPVERSGAQLLRNLGVTVIEEGAALRRSWAHDWAAVVLAVARNRGSRVNRGRLAKPLLRVAKDPELQRALMALVRLGGADGVCSLLKLPRGTRGEGSLRKLSFLITQINHL